jgi:hypothetical protein
MTERKFDTTAAFHELMDLVRNADSLFLKGPRAVDDTSVLEGYRWITEMFWNMCLWNPYMQTYDYRYEQVVTINGGQVKYEPDGSWRIVIAAQDPGVPNWVSTAGHRKGVIWFRWFLAEKQP